MLSEFEHAPEYVDSDYPTNDPDTGQNCCAPQECGEQSSGSPLDFDEPQPEEFSSICRRFSGCATVESSALERSAPMCVSSPSNYDISCAGGMKEGSLVFERNPGLAESKATSTRTDDPNQATDTDRYDFEFGSMNPTNGHKSSRSLNDITTNQNGGPPRPQRRLSRDKNGPSLAHRMRHNTSILALAVSPDRIFAGTQKGQILVCEFSHFSSGRRLKSLRYIPLILSNDWEFCTPTTVACLLCISPTIEGFCFRAPETAS